jgi:hypothetical protein
MFKRSTRQCMVVALGAVPELHTPRTTALSANPSSPSTRRRSLTITWSTATWLADNRGNRLHRAEAHDPELLQRGLRVPGRRRQESRQALERHHAGGGAADRGGQTRVPERRAAQPARHDVLAHDGATAGPESTPATAVGGGSGGCGLGRGSAKDVLLGALILAALLVIRRGRSSVS